MTIPYGYNLINNQVVIDDKQASVVTYIFDSLKGSANPKNMRAMANELNTLGIAPPNPSKTEKWITAHISNVFKNSFRYAGYTLKYSDLFPTCPPIIDIDKRLI